MVVVEVAVVVVEDCNNDGDGCNMDRCCGGGGCKVAFRQSIGASSSLLWLPSTRDALLGFVSSSFLEAAGEEVRKRQPISPLVAIVVAVVVAVGFVIIIGADESSRGRR
jgi:hypothetical protein